MAQGKGTNEPLEFTCTCGNLRGEIAAQAIHAGTHVVCFCPDCRAAELFLGQPDPAPGPVDLFQTTPDAITLTAGSEHLGLLRLSPRGTMRWYATCCKAPLFNTLSNPKFPFSGVQVARMPDPERVGAVVAQGFVPQANGNSKHKGAARMAWGILTRMIATQLSGRWRQTPFFDVGTGKPVAKATVPSKAERAACYPR